MKTRILIALLASFAWLALSACGNKGPLVRAPVVSPDMAQDAGLAEDDDIERDPESVEDSAGKDPSDDNRR